MRTAVIEDMDRFLAFLAAQPICAWSAQKQRELGVREPAPRGIHPPSGGKSAKKNDNAELAAALASMA